MQQRQLQIRHSNGGIQAMKLEAKNDNRLNEQLPAGDGSDKEVSQTIPVMEEQVRVEKQMVETGKVHISKKVHEHPTSVTIPLITEEYNVERLPVNKVMDTPPPAQYYEGETMIIPVVREVLVVEKRYEVVEEIRVTKKITTRPEIQQVTLLKEEVNIERRPVDDKGQQQAD